MAFEISKVHPRMLLDVLGKIDLFSELKQDVLYELVNSATKVEATKNSYIFNEGDIVTDFFILTEGSIKVSSTIDDQKEVIHRFINTPSIFGLEHCCVGGPIGNAAICLSPNVSFYRVPFRQIQILMSTDFKFNLNILSFLVKQIKNKEQRVERLLVNDARTRIVNFIKSNALKNGVNVGLEVLLKHNFRQQDIADFTGTSRQTVTNTLKDLKSENIIHVERGVILIRDIDSLK